MRKSFYLLMALFLTACASNAPSISYRTANHDGAAWQITAKAKNGVLKNNISILINNQVVASGSLHDFKMSDTFNGEYKGKAISAECEVKTVGVNTTNVCNVFVEGERAASLNF